MELGIFAKTYARDSLQATLDAVQADGLRTVQFNLVLTGGSSLPGRVPAELAGRVAADLRRRDLRMAAVSGTYNMAHPDAASRADGGRRLAALIAAARGLGTRVVTLCTGSRDSHDMWRRHPDNGSAAAWTDMRASVDAALAVAEAHDVTLAFEPERNNVVANAADGRRLLDEIGSPHLRVVLDAANLFDGPDLSRQDQTLAEAFALLGDDVVLAHAKDVRADGTIVAAGQGQLDYGRYLDLLAQLPRDVPLILHGLDEHEVAGSVRFLSRRLATA
jgi:sugar phosphate isomerase/epimerase